jgi:hypothetical protein
MLCDAFAQLQFSALFALEQQIRAELYRLLIELDAYHATADFARERRIDFDLSSLGTHVTRFELDVAYDIPALENEVVAAGVDLRPKELDIPDASLPEASQQFADEQVVENAGSEAGLEKMSRICW